MRWKAWIAIIAVGIVVVAATAFGWRLYRGKARIAAEARAVRARDRGSLYRTCLSAEGKRL
jgi:hypothetical protein